MPVGWAASVLADERPKDASSRRRWLRRCTFGYVRRQVILAVFYGLAVVSGVVPRLVPVQTANVFVETAFGVVVIIAGYFLLGRSGFGKHFAAWLVVGIVAGLAVTVATGH